MTAVPRGSPETSQLAFPLAASMARAEHPVAVVPSISKVTAPASGAGLTVAVNVTLWPDVEGWALLASLVVVAVRSGVTAFEQPRPARCPCRWSR